MQDRGESRCLSHRANQGLRWSWNLGPAFPVHVRSVPLLVLSKLHSLKEWVINVGVGM